MGEFGLTTPIASLRASHHGVKCTMPLTWRTCRVGKSPLADWGLQTSALFNSHYGNKSQMKNVYSFALKVIRPGNILQSVSKVEYTCNCFTNITPKTRIPLPIRLLDNVNWNKKQTTNCVFKMRFWFSIDVIEMSPQKKRTTCWKAFY